MNQHSNLPPDTTIPMEMRLLLRALSDDKSVAIVAELLRNGKMRFGEIKDMFRLSSSSLSNKLKKLQNGNLVVNFYAKGDDLGHSYYDATEISKLVFDSLYNIMYAPSVPLRRQDMAAGDSNMYQSSEDQAQTWTSVANIVTHNAIHDNASDSQHSINRAWSHDANTYGSQIRMNNAQI